MKITKKVHQISKTNLFPSASAIVDEVMSSDFQMEKPSISRPKPINLIRRSNYQRQKNRPFEPHDISFVLDNKWIQRDFLQEDIKVHGARHILFATLTQHKLLISASVIYCDATFKVVPQPFCQLFSLHSFLSDNNGEDVKQVPIVFVLISRRRKRDYRAIFNNIKEMIPYLNLFKLITDFEIARGTEQERFSPTLPLVGIISIQRIL